MVKTPNKPFIEKCTALTTDLSTPDEFFFELVHSANQRHPNQVEPDIEFYLVRLLKRFINSEHLYTKSGDGELNNQPLAFLLKEALDEPDTRNKKSLFQNTGDISLYKVGFFQESIQRSQVDVDYYIGMGEIAYTQVAEVSLSKSDQTLFRSLAKKFPVCVDVIFDVSEKTTPIKTEQDLFRLYKIWLQTGSERAARVLTRAGIPLKKEEEAS